MSYVLKIATIDKELPLPNLISMNPKVVILTAGIGSRLQERTKYFNKALLRVGNKAAISHTVDEFPLETEFVIGLGYKGDIVKQYLQMFHSDRKFTFVEIDKYSVPGSGPGYALLKCKSELQCPFYFISCDSIIDWKNTKNLSTSWSAYSKISQEHAGIYCTIETFGASIQWVHDKSPRGTDKAYVGVSFVSDYLNFWHQLEQQQLTVSEEIQVAPVFLSIPNAIAAEVDWWDVGSEEGLQKARKHFKGIDNLDKLDEEIYFKEDVVVKYFHNESMVKNRVERSKRLGSAVPEIVSVSKNFYKYKFAKGVDIFAIENPQDIMLDLLDFSSKELWKDEIKLGSFDSLIFKDVCKNFYLDKTMARLEKFFEKRKMIDCEESVNGRMVPSLKYMFERLPWDSLVSGLPSNFHGDWIFANTIYDKDAKKFTFVDWRQEFGGLLEYGDRYYDFAKMYACLLWPHPSVKTKKFGIFHENHVWIEIPDSYKTCSDILTKWLFDNKYDVRKAKLLTAIVWLNMAPLHESPLDIHLYYMGKDLLYSTLTGK